MERITEKGGDVNNDHENSTQLIARALHDRSGVRNIDIGQGPPCRQEGNIMRTIDHLLHSLGRFVFGLGVGLALTAAVVIVANGPALEATTVKPVDVVKLDPVIVTISAERFDAVRGEAGLPPVAVAHPVESKRDDG